ncbi:OPA family sugar phosphate sensor protein UhpC-like MFS transporter [Ereboglobus sp. PH5-10]|uniref:MFS transporter n=1 Tax=Ereboglobus sp. PH5-10 TaxID=2940629 RepID=UPI00240662C4|nr:MFS transporter [Ereboglobus sp. PH5-10]MDF9826113.1 OPA family sugar phosphate sensor protein UhpC-like MFS transporter [Ereboglobus sp. PH5-10]
MNKYNFQKWGVFTAATIGYGLYYVCRLSLNVVKKPMVDDGYLTETQLGIIGSALFFSYAAGKFINGFLADRVNVRYFMAGSLLVAVGVNFLLGFAIPFWALVILWGLNGWFQSAGGPCSVIALNNWFSSKQRGTVYGFWSASHNIGEAATYILAAVVVGALGWQYGFWSAACMGAFGVVFIFIFLKPSPPEKESVSPGQAEAPKAEKGSVKKLQIEVIKNPIIWLLALASGVMYICRYAVNSWGIYYFAAEKSYTLVEAGSLVSVSAVCGTVGTIFSGWISDRFFNAKRLPLAWMASLANLIAIALFMFAPHSTVIDIVSMVLFGVSIGVLISFMGGLIAMDLAPKGAVGAAVGIIGLGNYIGAGMQEILSGYLIESNKTIVDGQTIYDFSHIRIFWVAAALVSLSLISVIWKKTSQHKQANG